MELANVAARAAFLNQNNLTITPVYSSELNAIQLTTSKTRPIPDLLTLKPLKLNDTQSPSHSNINEELLSTGDATESAVKCTKQADGNFRRPRQIFTLNQETELADYVLDTSKYYSGLSSKEVRILAFVYGICNRVDMPSGWYESHQASFDWIVGFMKRSKLPSTTITGISMKGSSKQSKLPESKSNKIMTNQYNNTMMNNNIPIEIE